MSRAIVCYGGFVFTSPLNYRLDNVMNMLNLTNRNGTLSDNLKDLWQSSIDIDNNVDLTARTDP